MAKATQTKNKTTKVTSTKITFGNSGTITCPNCGHKIKK